jgi:RNA polymerase sigma-70 factor (ECF subfamily)
MAVSRKVFADQVLALSGSLQGVARRLTCNDSEAEDLVAETVARAWHSRDALKDPAAFRAWIFRILHNTFISERRRVASRREVHAELSEDAEDSETPFSLFEQMHQPFLLWFSNPEQQFLDKVLRQDLERALCSLPEHYRVVVVLSDLEEFSYGEIAEALEIPIGTVRSRLARARGALQRILWDSAKAYGLSGTGVKPPSENVQGNTKGNA